MALTLTITIAVCLLALLYVYRRRRMQLLQGLGIVVAGKPNVIFGSMLDFRNLTMSQRLRSWTQKYGKIYGYYEGPRANVVCSDLDFLQEVFVKQFSAFNGRKLYPIQTDPDGEQHVHMFFAQNERWKRLRKCANPAFSTAKMRQMMPTIESDIDRFMKNMEKQCTSGESFNIYDFYQRLTLDIIFECAFGVHINAQDNPQSIYLTTIRSAFSRVTIPVVIIVAMFLYELRVFLRWLYGVLLKIGLAKNAFHELGRSLVPKIVRLRYEAQRQQQKENDQKDLIQLMLDAQHDGKEAAGINDNRISLPEIEAQINLFMLAGYETSSTTLAYCSYLLATNPDVQTRLQQEIDQLYDSTVTLTYDDIGSKKLEYLDMVILETLRLYPIAANVFTRMCMHDTEVRGLQLKQGVNIVPDVWSIHYDPEIWGPEDPNRFYPERFSPELHSNRHPLSLLAFGAGPRTCIGMRFAQMEIKMTLVRLLRLYRICECPETEKPLQLREVDVVAPSNGVFVRLEARNSKALPS